MIITSAVLALLLISGYVKAQVATGYNFSTTAGNYIEISGGHTWAKDTAISGASKDDDAYFLDSIGFQFYYNNNSFNQFWVNANGFIKLGDISTPPSSTSYAGPPVSLNPNCISAFSNDLMGQGVTRSTSVLRVEVIGTAPFRTCVIQYKDWSAFPGDITTAGERYNFQIRLNENDGNGLVEIIYGGFETTLYTTPTARLVQAGISGAATTDFNVRTTGTNWATTTTALLNTNAIAFYNTNMPDSGRTFTWTVPPAPMVIDSVSTKQVTEGVLQGTVNNPLLAAIVYTHGNTDRKVITQINFNTTGTTATGNISNARVYYTGTSNTFSGIVNQFGSTISTPLGALVFTGSDTLQPGANYFWLTYDVAAIAPLGNFIDAQCTNVTDSFLYTHTPNAVNPVGSRKIIQRMSGDYTINPAGGTTATNFISFDNAVLALQDNGISGTVKFTIAAGTYTFSTPLNINPVVGSGYANRIVFEGTNAASVILTGSINTSPIVRLNQCNYVSLRNLTINNTASGVCSGVSILGSPTSNAGTGTSISNCIINLPGAGTSASTACIGLTNDLSGGTFTTAVLMDSVILDSNTLNGGYYGIGIYGALNNGFNRGIKIRGNTINTYYYGIYANYLHHALYISNNTFTGNNRSIYLTNCNNSSTQSHTIIGNKITEFLGYGIYISAPGSNSSIPVKLYNNFISSAASSGTYCIYFNGANSFAEVFHNTLIYNYGNSTASYGPLYYTATGTSNLVVKNNIFFVNTTTGVNTCLYLGTNPLGNDVNYNNYYNKTGTNLVYRNGVTSTPLNFLSAGAGGDTSYNRLPTFAGIGDFHLADACNPRGTNLNIWTPNDIEGQARSTTPFIGCDERATYINDMSAIALVQPLVPITPGLSDLIVRVKNMGSNTVTSFNVGYINNGGTAVIQAVAATLLPCDTLSVLFTGSQQITLFANNNIKTFTSSPNASVDGDSFNDTLFNNLRGPLNGTYTIGTTGADFNSFSTAVNALQVSGVSGPVTFNVNAGIYNEQVIINGAGITGLNAASPIIFNGANVNTTAITANINQQGAVILNQCKYISFRNITINNTNTANPVGFAIVGNATAINNGTACSIKNCIVNVSAIPGNTSYGIVVTSSANGYGFTAIWADSVELDSNTVNGASYGIGFYGRQNILNNFNIKFRNNTVTATGNALHIYYIYNPFEVLNNTLLLIPSPTTGTGGLNGIYMSTNTISSTTQSTVIAGNKISNAQNYGIYCTSPGGTATAPLRIYNNSISSSTDLAYNNLYLSATSGYADIFHNTFIYNAITLNQNYGSLYVTGNIAGTSQIKNNILGVTSLTGIATPLYLNSNPATGAVDFNIYFNKANTNLLNRNAIFYTASNYNTSITGGDSSFNIMPSFVNLPLNDLHLSSACSPRGLNLNSIVPNDIDGTPRNNPPQIGSDENTGTGLDLLAEKILTPVAPVSPGLQDLIVKVRNNGSTPITSFNIAYRLNGGTVVSQLWNSGTLYPCDTLLITFTGAQQLNILAAQLNSIRCYTFSPNAGTDIQRTNDTLDLILGTPMSGTYIIGSTPSDFSTINAAVDQLKLRGVNGAVLLNIKTGVYTEQLMLSGITGLSALNTLTFKSVSNNRNDVTLNYNAPGFANNYVVRMVNNYINFKSISIEALNPALAVVFDLMGGTSFDTLMDCNITSVATTSSSTDRATIYANGFTGSNLVIIDNTISNGSHGVYINGTSAITDGNVIDNNQILNVYYRSIFLYYSNNVKIRRNIIIPYAYTAHSSIYTYYANNAIEISGNRINQPAGGYGITTYYSDGTSALRGVISNNIITIGGTSKSMGIYLLYSSYQQVYNNSVNVTTTSTAGYAAYFDFRTTISGYNNIFNNIFSNTGGAYAVGNYNPVIGTANTWDYNLLYTSGAVLYQVGSPAATYTTIGLWKAASNFDKNSLSYRAAFTSSTNLIPNASDTASWALNGRGIHLISNTQDIMNNPRASTVLQGAPDLGAYEFTPSVYAPMAVAIPTVPAAGTTQVFMFAGDTVGKITWAPSSLVPTEIAFRYYSGVNPPNVNNSLLPQMFSYWDIQDSGLGFYSYDLNLYYKRTLLGNMPIEGDIRLAAYTGGVWTTYIATGSTIDTVTQILSGSALTDFSLYTGTDITTPLPVVLTSFQAKRMNDDVLVYWSTASEKNADRFIIEASFNGTDFINAGIVNAKGNSNELLNYQYNHINAQVKMNQASIIYYRLKSIDRDGSATYSKIVSVNFQKEVSLMDGMSIFPNPFSDDLQLSVVAASDFNMTVEITDLQGRIISSSTEPIQKGLFIMSITSLQQAQPGVYIIRTNVNGESHSFKVIKE